ncbi:hypothetical protein ACFVT1_35750 [Streptomyces sp. NPDC057963]|uniref:hypothetical protein n=1 Tax=Streptomyces sp. NPDC057963 TaxID=3346290 RepID=UPI0036E2947C
MRRRIAVLGTGAALFVAAGVMTAPSASATSFCFTSQGSNWGSVSCQTTLPKNSWQLVLVCNSNSVYGAQVTVNGRWYTGDGSDTLYCPTGYSTAYTKVNNNN